MTNNGNVAICSENERITTHHLSPFAKINAKISAFIRFRKIKKALAEVEQIEAGIIKPKTLEQFLNEL
jgi:hypothetical protein